MAVTIKPSKQIYFCYSKLQTEVLAFYSLKSIFFNLSPGLSTFFFALSLFVYFVALRPKSTAMVKALSTTLHSNKNCKDKRGTLKKCREK